MGADVTSGAVDDPSTRFSPAEVKLLVHAADLMTTVAAGEGLSDDERFDFVTTSAALGRLVYPLAADVGVVEAVLEAMGWDEAKPLFDALTDEQTAWLVGRMHHRASTIGQQEGTQ